jgi:hypothetical protein
MKKFIYVSFGLLISALFAGQIAAQSINDSIITASGGISKNACGNFFGKNFIDKNKNGLCDRFENGNKSGKSVNFVDADHNGVCDRFDAGSGYGNGKGNGYRNMNKQGKGCCGNSGCCGGKGNRHSRGWKR